MTDKIPSSWIYTKLENIVDIFDYERNPINNAERAQRISNKDPKELFSYYGATGQIGFIDDYRSEGERILLGEDAAPFLDPNKDKAYLVHGKYWVNNHAHILGGACNLVNNKFVLHQLNILDYREYVSGTTRLKLTSASMKQIPLVLAPYNEQIRIADKIDELFSELNNGIAELETAQKKLELYRQSLLKSAVEGELSKEWRETQTEVSETGEQLLARILKERRERWEQEKLKEFTERGKNPPKDWQDKYPEPVHPYNSINLPKLPKNWTWASLDQLAYPIRNGMSPKPNTEHKGYPILRINAVRAMKVYLDECRHLDLPYEDVKNFILKNNDILITRYNGSIDLLGVFGVVRDLDEPMLHPDKLIRAQPILGEILSNWIELAANIGHSRAYVKSRAKTTSGQTGVSGEDIKQTPIALPPLAEQLYLTNLISLELENMSDQFDSLETTLKQASNQKLNILKDAFSGKLVPQDPNDEPAQVLLERIQQQREAEAVTKKAITKKRSTSKSKKEIGMSKSILEILQQQSDWISGQELAGLFGINGSSDVTVIENFYRELKTLTLEEKICVKPDNDLFKTQDLFKYLG
ncbi:TPA: restriction endonuclease subunit S [Acinetobacter baumannii]|nr:restriction endonuclease subunit S [Acinetobacter baumannii]